MILRPDPKAVKAAMETDIQANAAEREAKGEHKTGKEAEKKFYFGFVPRFKRKGLQGGAVSRTCRVVVKFIIADLSEKVSKGCFFF
jgi:hypothetical protein